MEQDIRAWRALISHYFRTKQYKYLKQLPHLLGYLKRCEAAGKLEYDPYANDWRKDLRLLILRAHEDHQLALVSLYEQLAKLSCCDL